MANLELAQSIAKVIGWDGGFTLNTSRPDGMPRKVMDASRPRVLGWSAPADFGTGMKEASRRYLASVAGSSGSGSERSAAKECCEGAAAHGEPQAPAAS